MVGELSLPPVEGVVEAEEVQLLILKNPCIPLVAVASLWPFALTFWHEGPESIYSDLRHASPFDG